MKRFTKVFLTPVFLTPVFLTLGFLTLALSVTAAFAQSEDWQTLPLTDARTGETFTLAELGGTVYVEPMATWCSNCRAQLGNVQAAQAQVEVGDGDVTFVALSVETTLEPAALAEYADEQGFDFTFAVMTPELLRALAAEFGQSVANPPATPHFVRYPDGSSSKLMTGFSPPDAVLSAVTVQ